MNQNEKLVSFLTGLYLILYFTVYVKCLLQRERTNFFKHKALCMCILDLGCTWSSWKKSQWENSPLGSLKHPKIWCSVLSIFSLYPLVLVLQPSNRDWSEPFPLAEISPAGPSVRIDSTNVDPKWSFINWQSALMQGRPPEIILFNISTKKQEVIEWSFLLS